MTERFTSDQSDSINLQQLFPKYFNYDGFWEYLI